MPFAINPQPATRIASTPNITAEKPAVSERFSASGFTPLPPGPGPDPDPVLPDPVDVTLTPTGAGFRGGTLLIFGGQLYLNTARDSSELATWTGSNPIAAGPAAGASTLVSPDTDYLFGEFSIEFRRERPLNVATDSELLRFSLPSGAVVVSGAGRVFGDAPDASVQYAPLPDDEWVQLRLIRAPTRLYGFVGDTQVLVAATTDPTTGPVTLSVDALGSATRIQTRVRNFTVRSHASVNGLLVDDKTQPVTRQMLGTAPAASTGVAELGAAAVEVFGLFGWGQPSLNYTTQNPLLVGTEVTRTLVAYSDPAF